MSVETPSVKGMNHLEKHFSQSAKCYDSVFTIEDYENCKELILLGDTGAEPKDCFDLDGKSITQSQSDALIRLMTS